MTLCLIAQFSQSHQAIAQSDRSESDMCVAIDAIVSTVFKPGEPGAAVIVVQDERVIFRRGYGMADLELGVSIRPEMVFRLGSITKQFTAVAILMLAEENKLALDDCVGQYLPNFPMAGDTITIEHLLTHTSGIQNHTDMPHFWSTSREDATVGELIESFKHEPLEFTPGEEWKYSNSGYVLLGAIIENVSRQTYSEFIRRRIFEPLGMENSSFGGSLQIVPGRVSGYRNTKLGPENAEYFSMSLSYAAGALLSSVDDLAIWDSALYGERLISQKNLQRAFTPFRLNGGALSHYGYGWEINDFNKRKTMRHSGAIPGFTAYAMRISDERLFIAILANSESIGRRPTDLTFRIADLFLK